MNETLGNLVALTLQHGQYEIRRTTDPQECRDLVNDWAPHLAFIDLLAAKAGKAVSREDLLATIWGGEFEIESNVVDRHIRELRVKLNDEWRAPRYIETVPGAGYRFKSQSEVSTAAE